MEKEKTGVDIVGEYLVNLIAGVTEHPELVELKATQDDMGILYTVKVHQEDAGRIIGKAGQNVGAIRHILMIVAMKYKIRASLKLDVPAKPVAA